MEKVFDLLVTKWFTWIDILSEALDLLNESYNERCEIC